MGRGERGRLRGTVLLPALLVALCLIAISPGGAAPSGLVAAYSFSEGAGTAVADGSGSGNAGTVTGAAWTSAGRFGSALSFDATKKTNAVTVPDSASLQLTSALTLEAWVNPTTLGTSWRTAILKERTGGLAYALYANDSSSHPVGQVSIGGTKSATGSASLPLNAWTHLATTYDGAALRLYVNGTQVASRTQTGALVSSTGPLKIGGNSVWAEWFAGLIDEVRVYNRALTAAEIQTDMTTPVAGGGGDTTPPSTPGGLAQTGATKTSVSFSWTASTDDMGVVGYGLYRDDAPAGTTTSTSAALSGLACGTTYSVAVDAADLAGNRSGKATVNAATTACDTGPPTTPTGLAQTGATKTSVTVSWTASTDDVGVVGYGLYRNGTQTGTTTTTSATFSGLACGTGYTIAVDAADAAGNRSAKATVNAATTACDSGPPTTPTGLGQTGATETSVSVSWTASTDDVGVVGYGLYRNGTQTGTTTTTSATFSGLACGTGYTIAVDAADAAGNRSGKASTMATTSACDTTAPAVAITSPAPGTVNGLVTVSASASDDRAVTSVQFRLDGNTLGPADTSAPYSTDWDTTGATNGGHALTAVARDAAGNSTTSSPVTVTVANQAAEFVTDTVIVNLSEPTDMTFAPDGRMLIAERDGTIWVAQPGAVSVDPTPLLQVPSVQTADERGLLGIELDPSFATNGWMYVFFTSSQTRRNEVTRYTVTGNTANPASAQVIWRNDVDADIWHQGGDLEFGPDGYLYVSVGDHLRPTTAQDLDSYNGKILRMRADGSVPTDNPFYDGSGPNKDAIWVLGLRNPFRFSIDDVTGRLYIGDVGQGAWEEVDLGVRGANYGWPDCEGNCTTAGMTNPIYTYFHTGDRDASVTGGLVYRGTQFPAEFQGSYFFGDYSQNWIKRITLDASGGFAGLSPFIPEDGSADGPWGDIVSITVGPDGSLYYVDTGPFATDNAGSIRRVRNANANQPPSARAAASPTAGQAPLTVDFSSAGSSDPEGQPLTYSWVFGDGATSSAANPTHVYASSGRYTARLTTSDGTSTTSSNPVAITVGGAPHPTILTPADGLRFRAGDTISFSGGATDPEDGTIPASGLSWKVVFHHEGHIHPFIDSVPGASGSFQVPTSGHSFSGNTSYEIVLTATDSDGIKSQTSVTVVPDKVDVTFRSQPAGLTVSVDGIPQTTPFTLDTLIGFSHNLDTASPQTLGGDRYVFGSWSDGGAKAHTLVVPASASTLTATFTLDSAAPPGLVAAYSFDEGNGGTLYDASGNGHDGTLSGPVWTGTGKHGGALLFDGSSDIVTVADANDLDFTTGLTLEAWVSPTALGPWRTVVFKERTGGMNYALYANDGAARPRGQVFLANEEQNAIGTAALPLNGWTHLATTYDGATLRFFVNGTQVASQAITGSLAATTGALRLGGNGIWGEFFAGQLDDVRLYGRALSATEIQHDLATAVGA